MAETPTYNNEINTIQPLIINDDIKQESNPFILPPEIKIQNEEIHIPFKNGNCLRNVIIIMVCFYIFGILGYIISISKIMDIVLFFNPIFLFLCFYYLKKKLIIVKDIKNNSLNIKQKNYLCCSKKYKFSLDNSAFYCEEVEGDNSQEITGLNIAIINTLKSQKEINFLNSSIRDTPLKFIHIFHNFKLDENLEMKLNNYIDSPGYINVEPDEYKEYIYRYKKYQIIDNIAKK